MMKCPQMTAGFLMLFPFWPFSLQKEKNFGQKENVQSGYDIMRLAWARLSNIQDYRPRRLKNFRLQTTCCFHLKAA